MKGFSIKKINKAIGNNNNYFIAPHPIYDDFFTALNYFNKTNTEIESGVVYLDLMTLVGNRDNRFISALINDYNLDVNSIKVIEHCDQLEDFTKDSYSKLSENTINLVYPIKFRNEILEKKSKSKIKENWG